MKEHYLSKHANVDGLVGGPDKIDGVVLIENWKDEGILGSISHSRMPKRNERYKTR